MQNRNCELGMEQYPQRQEPNKRTDNEILGRIYLKSRNNAEYVSKTIDSF